MENIKHLEHGNNKSTQQNQNKIKTKSKQNQNKIQNKIKILN